MEDLWYPHRGIDTKECSASLQVATALRVESKGCILGWLLAGAVLCLAV